MNAEDIIRTRLANQRLSASDFTRTAQVVSWLCAMQAQEFAMAMWAIGLRAKDLALNDVETSFNKGEILRTHALRPTWHFVSPKDIRWLLNHTAPRVHALNAYWYRKSELTNSIFNRSQKILQKNLAGKNFQTREELLAVLQKEKITVKGLQAGYLFMHAELEQLICSGPRKGKQFTYALIEERVPKAKVLSREESLIELTNRYFFSRGPATIQDFSYWSGLSIKECRAGIEGRSKKIISEKMSGEEYFFAPAKSVTKSHLAFLMPDYDEYGMSYKNKNFLSSTRKKITTNPNVNPEYSHWLVVNGLIEGVWTRGEGKSLKADTTVFAALKTNEKKLIEKAVHRYTEFVGA